MPCSSKGTADSATQSTLHRFFKSTSAAKQNRPTTVNCTRQHLGIHVFTDEDISKSKGLDKQYKIFWNDIAKELCQDKDVQHKLKDKSAIQGAINTSWTIHKTDLLQLQADELCEQFSLLYEDEVARTHNTFISGIKQEKDDRAYRV